MLGWAVFLRGCRVSPVLETEAEARSWARCYYDLDHDENITIQQCYEEE